VNDTLEISKSDLPYLYANVYTIPATTPAGVQDYTVSLQTLNGCDSIITLRLTIRDPLQLLGSQTSSVSVYPNPVKRGGVVFIDSNFSDADKNGLRVELFNMLGEKIFDHNPTVYPVAIKEFPVSGVYLLRITTGTNQQSYGKIVVE
jgi:hypothetical protein